MHRARAVALLVFASMACAPAPVTTSPAAITPASGMVTVAPGVRLHYVDWGGTGPAVLLIHGLFGTADIYSELAPRLTDRYRVVGMTLRGHGKSDEPETGYEPDTLVHDIRAFLDSLGIRRAHLVGHSLGGVALSAFAATHPQRVGKLVYLDAAYDRQAAARLPPNPIRGTSPTPTDLATRDSYISFARALPYWRPIWAPPVEAMLRSALASAPGGGMRVKPSPEVLGKIRRGFFTAPPRYDLVRAPVLSIYALLDSLPELPAGIPMAQRDSAIARHRDHVVPLYERASIDQLRRAIPGARIVEWRNTHHYIFVQRRDEVVALIRDFLGAR